jgi:hypothetical protein
MECCSQNPCRIPTDELDAAALSKIKQCRRVATRYDKLAANFVAFIKLASIRIWLRAKESAPWIGAIVPPASSC